MSCIECAEFVPSKNDKRWVAVKRPADLDSTELHRANDKQIQSPAAFQLRAIHSVGSDVFSKSDTLQVNIPGPTGDIRLLRTLNLSSVLEFIPVSIYFF